MATLKGTHITAFDSTPPGVVDARLHGGSPKVYRDSFEIGDTDNGDVTILARVPVDSIPRSLKVWHDALTSGALDFGLYKKNSDGTYTAVDDDAFASAYDPSSAGAAQELLFEAAATNIDQGRQALWEYANLTERPDYNDLYLAITHDTGTGADGTVLVDFEVLQ